MGELKTVENPGFSDKQMDKEKYVQRWVSWSKAFIKIAGSMGAALDFEERVKKLAEKAFDEAN